MIQSECAWVQVNRVTVGPGYLKMSLDPKLWAQLQVGANNKPNPDGQLQVWSAKHSHYWDANQTTGTPTNARMFDSKESIAGCYANTHVTATPRRCICS